MALCNQVEIEPSPIEVNHITRVQKIEFYKTYERNIEISNICMIKSFNNESTLVRKTKKSKLIISKFKILYLCF